MWQREQELGSFTYANANADYANIGVLSSAPIWILRANINANRSVGLATTDAYVGELLRTPRRQAARLNEALPAGGAA